MDSLLAPIPASKPSYTKKQVCNVFFKAILDANEDESGVFCCQCGVTRRQQAKCGYANLFGHIPEQHADYEV